MLKFFTRIQDIRGIITGFTGVIFRMVRPGFRLFAPRRNPFLKGGPCPAGHMGKGPVKENFSGLVILIFPPMGGGHTGGTVKSILGGGPVHMLQMENVWMPASRNPNPQKGVNASEKPVTRSRISLENKTLMIGI